ncbi:hypothetical protein DEO72_LG1g2317 [Vigna unguiculata]|uniref:Uncharacterized protein n=1 Tax=Vigna unguiculata TaxID=3917 RepID=A0A4D6KW30_VIGUN|nr:hypothetical protein DEO72_LG1g2317 [Vigna unguiculata]
MPTAIHGCHHQHYAPSSLYHCARKRDAITTAIRSRTCCSREREQTTCIHLLRQPPSSPSRNQGSRNHRSEPATIISAPRIIFAHHHGHRRSETRIRCAFHQRKPASHHRWHEEQPESVHATTPLVGSHRAMRTTMASFTAPAS